MEGLKIMHTDVNATRHTVPGNLPKSSGAQKPNLQNHEVDEESIEERLSGELEPMQRLAICSSNKAAQREVNGNHGRCVAGRLQ